MGERVAEFMGAQLRQKAVQRMLDGRKMYLTCAAASPLFNI